MITLYEKKVKGLFPPFYPSTNRFPADPFKLHERSFKNLGIGTLKDFTTNPIITEVLNGAYSLEFEYALDGYLAKEIEEEKVIKANGQLFRIKNIDKNKKTIRVLAKHIAYDLNDNFIEDIAPSGKTAKEALDWVLTRTQFKNNFTVESDITDIKSARYVRKNIFEVFFTADNSFINVWGGEFEFNNLKIILHKNRGQDRGLQIRYGKNLQGLDVKLDFDAVATRIMPQGSNGLLLPEKYIDSPLIKMYHTPIIRKINFDIGVNEETTEEQAFELMRQAVIDLYNKGIDKPKLSIKIDFIELSKVEEYKMYSSLEQVFLGDTVSVNIDKLKLNLKAKVVKTVYDCLKDRFIKLELGEPTPNFVSDTIEKQKETELGIDKKVGKDEIIAHINQSDELIGIIAKKISLEGYTTINNGFSVDLEGNMTANNATIKGDIFLPNSETKIIDRQGLLTNLEFIGKVSGSQMTSGNYNLLGFEVDDMNQSNTKTRIVFDAYIPENFTIVEAKVILNHFPLKIFKPDTSVAGWGYSRKIKLYKTGITSIYRNYIPSGFFKDTETEFYDEIYAMGLNGYTPSTPNDSNHILETFISENISSQLNTGLNRLKIESSESIPSYPRTI